MCVVSILAPCAALTFSGVSAILMLVTGATSMTKIEDAPEPMKAPCVFGMAAGNFVIVALLHITVSSGDLSSGSM